VGHPSQKYSIGILAQPLPSELDKPGTMTVRTSSVVDVSGLGIAVLSGAAAIASTRVSDIQLSSGGKYGRGVDVQVAVIRKANDPPIFGPAAKVTISGCLVEKTVDSGVFVASSELEIERTVIRLVGLTETSPRYPDAPAGGVDGIFGDAIAIQSLPEVAERARATIRHTRVEAPLRAGLSNFAADIAIADSYLECAPIDLDGESHEGSASYAFKDGGGNACGCGAVSRVCAVKSSMLKPPKPL